MVNRSISVGPGRDELATPGSADRQVSALGYVTDCAMRPGYLSYIYSLYVNKLSFCVVIRDLRIGKVHFIAHLL